MNAIERVRASPGGRRLLALVADPYAEKSRRRQRPGSIDGPLGDRVRLTGDALVDVVAGREPRVWTVVAERPGPVASELRRRMRGQVSSRFVKQAAHLAQHEDGYAIRVLDAVVRGPLADPVLTMRAAELVLDGPQAGELRGPADDLLAGTLRLADPDALRRRPEALVTLARLAVRPELTLPGDTREAARAALAAGALGDASHTDLLFALADLWAAPDAIEALELLRDLAAPAPLHESAEIDGALLRRADVLRGAASRPLTLLLAVARGATRERVRHFSWSRPDFGGPEARAVIAGAGPQRRPRWA
jgi:hypothetical protein